jgi:hypothetical protein
MPTQPPVDHPRVVCGEEMRYAGRFDLFALFENRRLVIIETKLDVIGTATYAGLT